VGAPPSRRTSSASQETDGLCAAAHAARQQLAAGVERRVDEPVELDEQLGFVQCKGCHAGPFSILRSSAARARRSGDTARIWPATVEKAATSGAPLYGIAAMPARPFGALQCGGM
jgi:hypothetical protein